MKADPGLVCPACGTEHPATDRFCARCGTPLVHAPGSEPERPLTEAAERARKIRPQYGEGNLVRVAGARNQAEAELLQGMLLEEGVPSLMRRSGGFDVPDFLASGPRDILVPASGAAVAREVLGLAPIADAEPAPTRRTGTPPWVRALAVALAVLIVALVAAGLYAAIVG
jgi:zinc-ribbon domain